MKRSKYYEHLIARMQNPDESRARQAQIDAQRLADVVKALQIRPAYLPVTHLLPAGSQNLPIPIPTDEVTYPIIVTGAITDGQDKRADFYIQREGDPIFRVGEKNAARLSLDAFAGKAQETGALQGIVQFEPPMPLAETDSITLQVYNDTNGEDIVNTCFVGNRIYTPNSDESRLSAETRANVLENIAKRPVPFPRYAVIPVKFVNGKAVGETPKADEPLFIVGFRATFQHATVQFGFDDEASFSRRPIPIWALASERANTQHLFNYLNSELFVARRRQLTFTFRNSINGLLEAGDGQLEILMRTV